VIVQNVNPIWVSSYEPVSGSDSLSAKAVYYVEKDGPDHALQWLATSVKDAQLIIASGTTKRKAIDKLKTSIEQLINGPVTMMECLGYDDMMAKSHNKEMHSINGNTTRQEKMALLLADVKKLSVMTDQTNVSDSGKVQLVEMLPIEEKCVPFYSNALSNYRELQLQLKEMSADNLRDIVNGWMGDSQFCFKTEVGLVMYISDVPDWKIEYMEKVLAELEDMDDLTANNQLEDRQTSAPEKATTTAKDGHWVTKQTMTPKQKEEWQKKMATRQLKKQLEANEEGGGPKVEKTLTRRVQDYQASIERIAAKCKSKGPEYIAMWFRKSAVNHLYKKTIADKLWGANWMGEKEITSIQWVVYCTLNCVRDDICVQKLIHCIEPWSEYQETHQIDCAWSELIGDKGDWAEETCIRSIEASRHNREVHALNGNTSLSRSMLDVDAAKDILALIDEKEATTKLLKGSAIANKLGSIPSDAQPGLTSIYDQSVIRGSTISNNMVITNNVGLNFPFTTLYPRTVRGGAGMALANSGQRLPKWNVAALSFMSANIVQSEYGAALAEAQDKANQMLARPDNVTRDGWSMIEVATLSRMKPYFGFSMDQCMLKMSLLHGIYSHYVQNNFIPFMTFQAIDGFTLADITQSPQLGYNNVNPSPVFGEDCGGATALFPFLNIAGTVAFHLTTATVPVAQRSNIIYCPTGLINGTDADGEMLALFIRMWAPYPACMHTVSQGTTDDVGGNAAAQIFIPKASLVQVAGLVNLHVMLPRATSARSPSTQAEANNTTIFRPSTGLNASTGLGANQFLNINFIGAALQTYNLCEYLYTWTSAHDITTITTFLTRLQAFVGIKESLARMREIADYYSVTCPSQINAVSGGATTPAGNSAAQFQCSDFLHVEDEATNVNWPQASSYKARMLIHQTDTLGWNLVVTNIYDPPSVDSPDEPLLEEIGRVNAVHWQHLRAGVFAAVWNSHVSSLGWNTQTWNQAYTNTSMPIFRNHIQKYFSKASTPGLGLPNSGWGPLLAKYFEATTGFCNASYKIDNRVLTFWDYRIPVSALFGTTYSVLGVLNDQYIPCTLPDVWQNLLLPKVPRYQMSFPPANSAFSIRGYTKGLYHYRIGQNQIGSWMQEDFMKPGLSAKRELIVMSDTRWNDRLMYVYGAALQTLHTGVGVPGAPPASTFPCQRTVALPPWINAFPISNDYMWNTTCMPCFTNNGLFIHAISTVINGAI